MADQEPSLPLTRVLVRGGTEFTVKMYPDIIYATAVCHAAAIPPEEETFYDADGLLEWMDRQILECYTAKTLEEFLQKVDAFMKAETREAGKDRVSMTIEGDTFAVILAPGEGSRAYTFLHWTAGADMKDILSLSHPSFTLTFSSPDELTSYVKEYIRHTILQKGLVPEDAGYVQVSSGKP